MSTFVIKMYEFGVGDQLYVCEDERLWDWLLDENVFLSHGFREDPHPDSDGGSLRVLSPKGFVFADEMMVPLSAAFAMPPTQATLCDWGYVAADNRDADRAKMLIFSPYHYVTLIDADEFKVLGIGNDRVFEIIV